MSSSRSEGTAGKGTDFGVPVYEKSKCKSKVNVRTVGSPSM